LKVSGGVESRHVAEDALGSEFAGPQPTGSVATDKIDFTELRPSFRFVGNGWSPTAFGNPG
jgi:hypothetical protein